MACAEARELATGALEGRRAEDLLGVHAVEALFADRPALALEQDTQPAIPEPDAGLLHGTPPGPSGLIVPQLSLSEWSEKPGAPHNGEHKAQEERIHPTKR